MRMGLGRQLRPIPIAREGMTGVDMNPADNKAVFEVSPHPEGTGPY